MIENDPLILHGAWIILACITIHSFLIDYLEYLFNKDDNYE